MAPTAVLVATRCHLEGIFGDAASTHALVGELVVVACNLIYVVWALHRGRDAMKALLFSAFAMLAFCVFEVGGAAWKVGSLDHAAILARPLALAALVESAVSLAMFEGRRPLVSLLRSRLGARLLAGLPIFIWIAGFSHGFLVGAALTATVCFVRHRKVFMWISAGVIAAICTVCFAVAACGGGVCAVFEDPWHTGYATRSLMYLAAATPTIGDGVPLGLVEMVPSAGTSYSIARVLASLGWVGIVGVLVSVGTLACVLVLRARVSGVGPCAALVLGALFIVPSVASNALEVMHALPAIALEVPFLSAGHGSFVFWSAVIASMVTVCFVHPPICRHIVGLLPSSTCAPAVFVENKGPAGPTARQDMSAVSCRYAARDGKG